jgi:GntR family transcriptional regulator/GntR family frlABCD operon transcriptional regulator
MAEQLLYQTLYNDLKHLIFEGKIAHGDLLPSENELCEKYKITRTTVRRALDELVKDRLISKEKGRGSVVRREHKSLGILSVKGFSQVAMGSNKTVSTKFIQYPKIQPWSENFFFDLSDTEKSQPCIAMKRLRLVSDEIVMLEHTFFLAKGFESICTEPFVNGSLFETFSIKFGINISGAEQDLRAILANEQISKEMLLTGNEPLLDIYIRFLTNKKDFKIYTKIICNTNHYSISNTI